MTKLTIRVLVLVLALALTLPLVASAEADPMAKYEPGISITTVKSISDALQTFIDKKQDVLTDNIWFGDYADLLGIEVSYAWTAPSAQFVEKLNTQIAANDLPDIIPCNAAQLKMLVEYGIATDLTQVFDGYATDFTRQMMEADNYTSISQATFDGKLMALPSVSGNRDSANVWWIRYDWLEKLGLAEPTTFDELVAVMYAFTNDDPDGNGEKDTHGLGLNKELFGGHIGVDALADGLRAYNNGWLEAEDGSLVYGGIQPEVKEMLSTLAQLYADGVLDREFIVKDSNKVSEEIVAGKIGMFGGQHWQAFWPLQDATNADPKADWRAISIVSNDGEKAQTMLGGSASTFYVVNIDCAYPEAAVKLYNYYYMKDPALSPDFDYRYHGRLDAEPDSEITQYYQWAALLSFYPAQNMFIHTGVESFFEQGDESAKENYWVVDNITQNEDYLAGNTAYWAAYRWSGAGDYSGEGRIHYYDLNGMFLQNAYIGANTDGMTQYNATLNQLRLETFTKIITGEATVDAFDSFVDQWKSLGGDAITAEVNAAK